MMKESYSREMIDITSKAFREHVIKHFGHPSSFADLEITIELKR